MRGLLCVIGSQIYLYGLKQTANAQDLSLFSLTSIQKAYFETLAILGLCWDLAAQVLAGQRLSPILA